MAVEVKNDRASPESQTSTTFPDIVLLGVALIWAVNIPIMKIGLEEIDDFVFNGFRFSISALVLNLLAWRERRSGLLPQITWLQICLFGMMIGLIYQILWVLGLSRTASGNVALIISTVPIWTAVFAGVFLSEKLNFTSWVGLLIALAGTLVVAIQGEISVTSTTVVGSVIVLLSAITWAAGTVYSRPLLKTTSPVQLAAWSSLISLPVHLLIAAACFGSADFKAIQSPKLWLIIIYSGTLSSGLAQPMWNYGVRHAGAAHAAVVQYVIPVITIFVAWGVRDEIPTIQQFVGGSLILCGLIVMRWAKATRQ